MNSRTLQNAIFCKISVNFIGKEDLQMRNEIVVIIGADARITFQCTRKHLNQPPRLTGPGSPTTAKETVRLMVGAVSFERAAKR